MANSSEKPRTQIFLSYSRTDSAFVDRLALALSDLGYDPLLDREDISGGEPWKERLEQLILQADAVVFVVSPASVASSICDWETKRTLELGKRLLPILLRSVESAPAQLSRLNYILFDTEERFESGLRQLCTSCDIDIVWVREHTRLTSLAARWGEAGRRGDVLLRGQELTSAESWLAARPPSGPEINENLLRYLRSGRTEEVSRARAARRARVFALGLTVLVIILVVGSGAIVSALNSGAGARKSQMLAALAKEAAASHHYDRAARYALAGLNDANSLFEGFDASLAESELLVALEKGNLEFILGGQAIWITGASFSPDGERIITSSEDQQLQVWSAKTGDEVVALRGVGGKAEFGSFSPDGRLILFASSSAVQIHDSASGRKLLTLQGHTGKILNASFSPDGSQILTLSEDRTARIWSSASGTELHRLAASVEDRKPFAEFSSTGSFVATKSTDSPGSITIWDARSGAQLAILPGDNGILSRSSFSTDDKYIVLASSRGAKVVVFNTSTGAEVSSLRTAQNIVTSARFSPDGKRIVTTSGGPQGEGIPTVVEVWDAEPEIRDSLCEMPFLPIRNSDGSITLPPPPPSWCRVSALSGQYGDFTDAHFGPILSWVVALSEKGPLVLWTPNSSHTHTQAADSMNIGVLAGHEGEVRSVSFSSDKTLMLTTSSDRSARVWKLPHVRSRDLIEYHRKSREELIRIACEGPLARGGSILTVSELGAAPFLDRTSERDVCAGFRKTFASE